MCAGPSFSRQSRWSLPRCTKYVLQRAFQTIHDLLQPAQRYRLLAVLQSEEHGRRESDFFREHSE